jgi:hypothetical protein
MVVDAAPRAGAPDPRLDLPPGMIPDRPALDPEKPLVTGPAHAAPPDTRPSLPLVHGMRAHETHADTPLVFTSSAGRAIAIEDPDGGAHSLVVTVSVTRGSLRVSRTQGLRLAEAKPAPVSSLTMEGPLDAINAALDGLTYVPDREFSGQATLCVEAGHFERPAGTSTLCADRAWNWQLGDRVATESTVAMWLAITVRPGCGSPAGGRRPLRCGPELLEQADRGRAPAATRAAEARHPTGRRGRIL